jgi:hypothetical protein
VQTAPLTLKPTAPVSKPDARDWTRELWTLAYRQARAQIRDRRASTAASAWGWFLQHARRRFTTPAAWRIAQAAGRIVFDRRTPTVGTSGSVADLERHGLIRRARRPRRGNPLGVVPYRCATIERFLGSPLAWGPDPLASSANRGLRVQKAKRLREERAAILAQLEAEERLYVLTDLGRAALVAAEMAADRAALTAGGSLATA